MRRNYAHHNLSTALFVQVYYNQSIITGGSVKQYIFYPIVKHRHPFHFIATLNEITNLPLDFKKLQICYRT